MLDGYDPPIPVDAFRFTGRVRTATLCCLETSAHALDRDAYESSIEEIFRAVVSEWAIWDE